MKIENVIRNNVSLNSHPLGLKKYVQNQIEFMKTQETFNGPKNVLIIGGSSGYGLASRIALTYGANAFTINVSFEAEPKAKRTGTAGWWNNRYFQEQALKDGHNAKDFIGDAFSFEMKEDVVKYIQSKNIKIDLVIYSLASGRRTDSRTGETFISALKSTTTPIIGQSIDFSTGDLFTQTMAVATEEDIFNTVKVMGGEDWSDWVTTLKNEDLLSEGFKTIAYTYIGPKMTQDIYFNGTIGQAKRHLEETCNHLNQELTDLHGEALISSSKAIVSKASAYIPIFPVYGAVLYKIMREAGIHENPIQHKYRLFKDMVYGTKRETDERGILRPDSWENRPEIQAQVEKIMSTITNDNFKDVSDHEEFMKEFNQLNGFMIDGIDYEEDIDLEELANFTFK